MTLLTHTATAYDFMVDGLAYSINNNTSVRVTCTKYESESNYSGLTEAIIPERVTYNGKTYSVTQIGVEAFFWSKNLTNVTIPKSVTYIGGDAFWGCSSLTSITIPNSVTDIFYGTFCGCENLTSVTIPNSVKIIGSEAFYNCKKLTSITIPESVTDIGTSAFGGCNSLTSIEWNAINCNDFYGYQSGHPFLNCPIKVLTIGNSVQYIPSDFMQGQKKLSNVIIPNSVRKIGSGAFRKCSALTNITIPNSVTTIGGSAFYQCTSLNSITIPNSVTTVGGSAFYGCSSLSIITIPNSVTHIGSDAFYGTPWFNNQPDGLVYAGRVAYKYKGTMPEGTSIAIKDGTVSISDHAFSYCKGLTNITIPNTVTEIGYLAFGSCESLSSVTIPNSVTSIGGNAFSGCSSLSSITIPNSVTRIGQGAFYGTPWFNNQQDGLVYAGRVAYQYKGTMPEGTSIAIKDGTVSISEDAFRVCKGLMNISIPNSVTSIGEEAFWGCTGLENITIPSSVTEIGSEAFGNCTNLKYMLCNAKLDQYPVRSCPFVVPFDLYGHYKNISPYLLLYIYPIYGISEPTCQSTTMTTATGISFTCNYFESPAITDCGIRIGNTKIRGNVTDNGDGQLTVTIDKIIGLTPGGCWITPYVTTHGIDLFGDGSNLPTKPVTDFETITPTVFSLSQFDDEETASIKKLEIYFDGAPVDGRSITGLIPGSSHTVTYRITSINTYKEISTTITTPQPILEVQAARMLSNTSPMLAANTNLADEETSCGFEWRRYDAPEELPSAQVYSPVFDGTMAGVLKNMSENVYYKYRPFLKDANGTMYYGDWIAFITADAGVEYEPILYSYKNPEVTQTEATLQGVALPGSSDITEQGFEYWRSTGGNNAPAAAPIGSVTKVKSSGQRMRTTVEGLTAGATYCFRSYAVSGGKTYYGDEVKFATEKPAAGNGDVNGDGRVDVEDVNAVINIILKQKAVTDYDGIADVMGDGRVDVEDVNAIINIILKV
ncbi:MAG: leucine-rich repeat protein [Muribaculaceae bacterium]|nr:leucine-rich repeat protein [Muribaculaceae bacterium]